MTSHPIWVEHEGEHLAAVVSLPDGAVRGVVTMPLFGAPAGVNGSHFYARLSRELVERGLATVRFEYAGLGDSTGMVVDWAAANIADQGRQTLAATRTAMKALEVSEFAVFGSCYDAAVALEASRDPACVGAVCVGLPATAPSWLGMMRRRLTRAGISGRVRRNAVLRRVLMYDRLRIILRDRPSTSVKEGLETGRRVLVLVAASSWGYDPVLERSKQTFRRTVDAHSLEVPIDQKQLSPEEQGLLDEAAEWLIDGFRTDSASSEPLLQGSRGTPE